MRKEDNAGCAVTNLQSDCDSYTVRNEEPAVHFIAQFLEFLCEGCYFLLCIFSSDFVRVD